jgi:cytochrome c5
VSSTQSETFSPHNIAVLGGLLAIALFIGEVVIGPSSDTDMAAEVVNTLEEMAMRLKPVVTLDDIRNPAASQGGAAGDTMAALAGGDAAEKTPEQLYQGACMACHAAGVAGAPKLGDAPAWNDRAAKGLDALVSSAVNGIGAMPPRGGSQLSDDQVRAVIEYMLENSK